jgi:hypothetical protein
MRRDLVVVAIVSMFTMNLGTAVSAQENSPTKSGATADPARRDGQGRPARSAYLGFKFPEQK